MTIIDTTTPSRSRTDDEDLIALIAAHEKLHEDGLPAGLGKADRKRASAIFDQIKATIPVTIEGVLAMLEYSDYEDDPLIVAAVAGFRAIVERCALEQPPLLAPGASDVQKLIAVEWRIRSMGIKISDAADDFGYWFKCLEKQDQSVHELGAGMDDLVSEARNLYTRISEQAGVLLDRINATPPITTLVDAIALLELDEPPIDAVIAGLRAIAEKGGAA